MSKLSDKPVTLTMLAKDVLKWLRPGSKVRIVPRFHYGYIGKRDQSGDVQEYLKSGKPCPVCGIGAIAAAAAFRKDKLKFDAWGSPTSNGIRNACMRVAGMPMSQANKIEDAFENGEGLPPIRSARGRLIVICENIIKHNGLFIPKG